MSLKKQLIAAVIEGDYDKVSNVLSKMTVDEVNEKDEKGRTALSIDEYGHTILHQVCAEDNDEAITQLLAIPAIDKNAKSRDGWTPLMAASSNCSLKVLKVMLESPYVDLDVKTDYGFGVEEVVGLLFGSEEDKKKYMDMIQEEKLKRTKNECPIPTEKPTVKLALIVFDETDMGKGRKTLRLNAATPMKEIKKLFPKHLGVAEDEFVMCVPEGAFFREVKEETPRDLFGSNLEGDDNVIKIMKVLPRPEEGLAKEMKTFEIRDTSEQTKSGDEAELVDRSEEKLESVERPVSVDMSGKEADHLPCSNVEDGQHEMKEGNIEKKKLKDKRKKPKCARASCRNRGGHRCSRCRAVYYCQQECLTEDWAHHKAYCDYVYEANKDYDDSADVDTEEKESSGGTVEEVD